MTTNTNGNNDKGAVSIPKADKDKAKNYCKQLAKNTKDIQRIGFELGTVLVTIKGRFNGDTKAYGEWLTKHLPLIPQGYSGGYIYMAENKKAIIEWMKAENKGHLSSCRSIQRQHKAFVTPSADRVTKDDTYQTDGKSLTRLIADMAVIQERIKSYNSAQSFDGPIKKQLVSDNKSWSEWLREVK